MQMKKLTLEEEKQLLENCIKNGEKDLIDKQYCHLIEYIIRKALNNKVSFYSQDDVEDLCHDVFVKIYENDCKRLKQYKPEKGRSLANWIIMITTQTVTDFTDRKNPHNISTREKLVPIKEEFIESLGFDDPEEKLENREVLGKVRDSLKKLSPAQALVIHLHYFDDPPKSLETIAKITHRTMQAVYSIKHRAIDRLKKMININDE